jgi:hypothetical protein
MHRLALHPPLGTRVANLGASLQQVQHMEKPFSATGAI